ncbi:MAG: glycosyltransferase [Candidatus Hermodarchaeota archaeon]
MVHETDWIKRGPHTHHHVFERLSKNTSIEIIVLDYDSDKLMRSRSLYIKKHTYQNIDRAIKNSKVKIIRTAHIQVPYIRRISSMVSNFIQMMSIIRKNKPDLIVSFSIANGFLSLLLSKIFKIPYIFYVIDHYHTLVPIKIAQPVAKIFYRFSIKYADQVIVVTKLLQNFVLNELKVKKDIKILLNGISLENTIVNEEKLKNLKLKLGIAETDFVLFFMGYLYDFAGLKEIIDYYHNDIKNKKYNFKFLIVGDGGVYQLLKKHIKDISADWVILAGRIPFFDITEYIELADLCLLSFDINEITDKITPGKIVEYMAMKKPVLSNNLPAVVIELGKNNGVVFAKNQKDLIRKIGTLSSQKAKLKEIGLDGFNFVKEKYNWSNIINDLKRIIIDLIRKKRKKND